jgi:hypothetical protein
MTDADRDFVTMVAWKADKRYGGNVSKAKRVGVAITKATSDPGFVLELRAAHALGGFTASKDVMYRGLVAFGLFKTRSN